MRPLWPWMEDQFISKIKYPAFLKKYTSLCINYQRNFEEEVWRYTDILLQRVG